MDVYRVGQVAAMVRETPHRIRTLCQLGLVPGLQTTDKGHFRIPGAVVEKWKLSGVPEIPAGAVATPVSGTAPGIAPYTRPSLARSPEQSGRLAESERVVGAAEDLAVVERVVKTRGLELQLEQIEDKFRERAGKEEREEAEREAAQAAEDAEYEQRRLLEAWCIAGIGELPADFPEERHVDVVKALRTTLKENGDLTNEALIQKVVNSVIKGFVGRWEREKEIERIVEEAIPFEIRYDRALKLEARAAVDREVRKSGAESDPAIEAAVERACRPLLLRLEHEKSIKRVLDDFRLPYGTTSREIADARDSVEDALYAIPPGSPLRKYEAARDRAIDPHVKAVEARQTREEEERKARQAREAQARAAQEDRALRASLLDENSWSLFELPASEKKLAIAEAREALEPLPFGTPDLQVREAANAVFDRFKAKHRLIESMNSAFVGSFELFIEKLNQKYELDADRTLRTVKDEVWKSIEPQLYEALDGTERQEEADKLMRQLVREELDLR
jgi:hypothetical protein